MSVFSLNRKAVDHQHKKAFLFSLFRISFPKYSFISTQSNFIPHQVLFYCFAQVQTNMQFHDHVLQPYFLPCFPLVEVFVDGNNLMLLKEMVQVMVRDRRSYYAYRYTLYTHAMLVIYLQYLYSIDGQYPLLCTATFH